MNGITLSKWYVVAFAIEFLRISSTNTPYFDKLNPDFETESCFGDPFRDRNGYTNKLCLELE